MASKPAERSRDTHSGTFSTARVSRRQVLKASLVGLGGLAPTAGGLAPLETLFAAPAGGWRQLFPMSAPSPRGDAAMAYDAARQMIVLFGGTLKDTKKDSYTWAWDGRSWNRLNPTVSPPAKSGASFAYHPPTETLVLFGGGRAEGVGDTWLWNGSTWIKVAGDGPPARAGASMAFAPTSGGLILFGGFGSGILDDTWVWNGKSWIRLSPRSSPPGRWGASLAYHSGMGKLILFGGKTRVLGGPEPEETWAWDGTNWSELSLDRLPPWRWSASMAEEDGGVLLFGGMYPASNAIGWSYLGDTWLLGSTWSEVTQAPAPPPRALASLAAYPPRNSLLLFGGASAPGRLLGDTWIW